MLFRAIKNRRFEVEKIKRKKLFYALQEKGISSLFFFFL